MSTDVDELRRTDRTGIPAPPRVVVIGAGAAGMIAAAEAASRGAAVTVLEKNTKTGVKILMSGGTRCNITQSTNAVGITRVFGSARRFLQPSVGAFPPDDVVAMFNRLNVETKIESTGKVFPRSDRAVQVRDALHLQMLKSGAQLRLRSPVTGVRASARRFGWTVETETETLDCDRVIVTAGGRSWPGCGTTGDAYDWLARLGHTIVRPRPALVPLLGGSAWMHELSGLTLDRVTASVRPATGKKRKPILERTSSLLFTHRGFSGPAVMDVSGVMTAADTIDDVELSVDLVPGLEAEALVDRWASAASGGRRIGKSIAELVPTRLAEAIVASAGGDCRIAEMPKSIRQNLIEHLKRLTLPVHGTQGFAKAEVTAGGVALGEVDPRTLESRRCPGLFIAGEVLDVDGWIGGYNFQAAFSTGRAAGIAAAIPG